MLNKNPTSFADKYPLALDSASDSGNSSNNTVVLSFQSPKSRSNIGHGNVHRYNLPKAPLTDAHEDVLSDALSSSTEYHGQHPRQPAISHLVLNTIPHRQVDETFNIARNVAGSALFEARAEATVDLLMRQWTYINPGCVFDDDQSSTSSNEEDFGSFPLIHDISQSLPQKGDSVNAPEFKRPSQDRPFDKREQSSPFVPVNKKSHNPPIFDTKSHSNTEPQTNPPKESGGSPSSQWAKDTRPARDDFEYQKSRTPSSPAPPYVYAPRCSACHLPVPPTACPNNCGNYPLPSRSPNLDANIDPDSKDRIVEVVDGLSSLLKHSYFQVGEGKQDQAKTNIRNETKARATQRTATEVTEEANHTPEKSAAVSQKCEPVILKDLFGRRFIFPFQTCRTWQVGSIR